MLMMKNDNLSLPVHNDNIVFLLHRSNSTCVHRSDQYTNSHLVSKRTNNLLPGPFEGPDYSSWRTSNTKWCQGCNK